LRCRLRIFAFLRNLLSSTRGGNLVEETLSETDDYSLIPLFATYHLTVTHLAVAHLAVAHLAVVIKSSYHAFSWLHIMSSYHVFVPSDRDKHVFIKRDKHVFISCLHIMSSYHAFIPSTVSSDRDKHVFIPCLHFKHRQACLTSALRLSVLPRRFPRWG
jgi:hypothetical protein